MYEVSADIQQAHNTLRDRPEVQKALDFLVDDCELRLKEQIELARIPGPSYHEEERAKRIRQLYQAYGLTNIHFDRFGNLVGVRRGSGCGPRILIDAHMDSVFPMDTVLEPTVVDGKIYMPGITDDIGGIAAQLSVLRALNIAGIQTQGDLYFAGIVEEEVGIKGMRNFMTENRFDAVISLDCAQFAYYCSGSMASNTYTLVFSGRSVPFKKSSCAQAIAAAARVADRISRREISAHSVFCVLDIQTAPPVRKGRTASEVTLKVTLRAVRQEEIPAMEDELRGIVKAVCEEENAKFDEPCLTCEIIREVVYPSAEQNPHNPLLEAAQAVFHGMGVEDVRIITGNSNSAEAIRAGIQALTLGVGGGEGGIHTLNEYFDPMDMHLGTQSILLLTLMMAGIPEAFEPVANKPYTILGTSWEHSTDDAAETI